MSATTFSLVPSRHRRLAPVALLTALLTALLAGVAMLSAPPAAAHDAIISSDPVDGTELTTSPAQITLTFNNDLSTLGGQIVVADAAGTTVASGEPVVTGPTAVLTLPTLANGAYSVTWRAVSSDSHPIEGTFAFSVADPAAEATEEPTVEATETAETTEAPAEETPTAISATAPADEADAAESDSGLPWTGIIIGAALGLGVGIVLTVLGKRRGRKD